MRRFVLGYQPDNDEEGFQQKNKEKIPPIEASFYSAESSESPMGSLIDQMEKMNVQSSDTGGYVAQIKDDLKDDFSVDMLRIFN